MSSQSITPLGRKIVIAILGTTLLALVLSFVLNLIPTIYAYRENAADRARAQAELMAASLVAAVDFDDAQAAQENLETLSLVPSVTGAAVYVGKGAPFAAFGVAPRHWGRKQLWVDSNISSLIVSCPIASQQPEAVVIVAVSLEGQWGVLKSSLLTGAVILCVVFLFSFKVAARFRRKLGDPLGELTTVVRSIAEKKDYSRRVEYVSDDEVGVLVAEFNAMLGQIQKRDALLGHHQKALEETVEERTQQLQLKQLELLRNNRLLLSEIKKRTQAEMIREEVERINRHDLKSGLSLVIGYPELLLAEGDLNERQTKHLKRIRAAGYRMLDMIRNQLNIFKMENGIYSLSESEVDLVEVVCSLEEEFLPLLEQGKVVLDIEYNGQRAQGDEVFTVKGEEPLMRTMFRNLIQNGIEASSIGDTVLVSLSDNGRKCITVSNSAPVPEEIRHRFFDKYVSYGKENGTGLGTYIASLIARTHGANITMKTDAASGTTMTVYFRSSRRLQPQI